MNNAEKIVEEVTDYLAEGFERIDPKYISARPPKIRWGRDFKSWPIERQITYLTKFADAMNHAADLLQQERDSLSTLCIQKEGQIRILHKQMKQNNDMLQSEVTKFNSQRQECNKEIARLNVEIKELKNGNKC